jgi:hypothetical protein
LHGVKVLTITPKRRAAIALTAIGGLDIGSESKRLSPHVEPTSKRGLAIAPSAAPFLSKDLILIHLARMGR